MDRRAWNLVAKTDPEDERMWLPLVFHLRDTASVMEYLVKNWLPNRYWENFGLSREEFYNLTVFAASIHDIGKATPYFQWRITEKRPELRENIRNMGLSVGDKYIDDAQIPHALAGAEILRAEGYSDGLASVVSAHHGKPESFWDVGRSEERPLSMGWTENRSRNTAWGQVQKELLQRGLDQVGIDGPEAVPDCPMAAQMLLSGLVIMADWIASNTAYFPLISMDAAPRDYDPERAGQALYRLNLPKPWSVSTDWQSQDYFERRFGFTANGVQKAVEQAAERMKTPGVMILEAPMGQGKTEAAMAAAEILMNRFSLGGVAFFLPSQATSNAMFTRMTRWAESQPDAPGIAVKLVHGQADLNEEFKRLEEGAVQICQGEPETGGLMVHSFFRGRKTGLLANLVVGTIDQLLMAALQQKHVMLRHLGLAGKVVIIDECHAYDAYMNAYLDRALDWLGAYGVPVILLSATLPGQRRGTLLQAYLGSSKPAAPEIRGCEAYPLLSWTEDGQIHWRPIASEGKGRTVEIQRAEEDQAWDVMGPALELGCVGLIVNTVRRAQVLRDRLKDRYPHAIILMDHSRLLAPDRLDREKEILRRVGKHSDPETRRGVLVIGTQVLEQSLDLDFDLLVTDLCPMDLLLQRIGRLHRHMRPRPQGMETARCIVLGTRGELDGGSKAVYGEYLLLGTRELLPEEIRLPEDISPLVQQTYNEIRWNPELGAEYDKAKEAYKIGQSNKVERAGAYRLEPPSRDEFCGSLDGLLDMSPGTSEGKAQAAVRDGSAPVEVLVVQRTEDGTMKLLSGEQKGAEYRSDTQPSMEEARSVAMQRLRLPGHFGQRYCVDEVLQELEAQTKAYLSPWRQAPMLEGELFLILDPEGRTELAGETLYYDPQVGLREKEEANGGN